MKILFIQGGTRCKKDKNNNWYTDTNFSQEVWQRYKSYGDELTVILRGEEKEYDPEYAEEHFNKFPSNINLITLEDVYRPKSNFFNFKLKRKIKNIIETEIRNSDFVIIRSIVNFYTLTATKICKKLKKRYMIEVTGAAFDGFWNYGNIYGKIIAIPMELNKKRYLKSAPYALYVTEKVLQNRYPCNGETLGCSDVEIAEITEEVQTKRKQNIENIKKKDKIILGTLASIDLKIKGQKNVIKALGKLKKQGITNFEYQLTGGGNKEFLYNVAKKNNVENQIVFLGVKPHEEVFDWLDEIDVYIQPSYGEGLCRALVEAMSRGCPVISSNAGGNIELVSNENIYKKRNVNQLVKILKTINKDFIEKESERSFEKAKKYEKELLNKKRDEFYRKAINH